MRTTIWIVALALVGTVTVWLLTKQPGPSVKVGSKKFTESVILGEMVAHLLRSEGYETDHRRELGGTRVLWSALLKGDIDAYSEYTGTISKEILADQGLRTEAQIRDALAAKGVRMTRPLGFNNTYALGMKRARAEELGIQTISDLRRHPDLALGFSNEFMDRGDGWPSLKRAYNLPQTDVRGLEHHLAYRALNSGSIAVTDLYSTDAEIAYYDIEVLEDDRGHFPRYEAVLLYRADLEERLPGAVEALRELTGMISEAEMIQMNSAAKLDRVPESEVGADFLREELDIAVVARPETAQARLTRRTLEHLFLVGISLGAAILVAVPLGIVAASWPGPGQFILGVCGVIQTIPSLALLVFMIPLVGIGAVPAMVALFLYSLLPIVRNTHAGLRGIAPSVKESAAALGLPPRARLRLVELPVASRSILAGIKTSAVINVGTATLGALIGAGGYGQPILTGIRLDNVGLILQGAVPAALLALLVQGLFELADRLFVPRGLRLKMQN